MPTGKVQETIPIWLRNNLVRTKSLPGIFFKSAAIRSAFLMVGTLRVNT